MPAWDIVACVHVPVKRCSGIFYSGPKMLPVGLTGAKALLDKASSGTRTRRERKGAKDAKAGESGLGGGSK